MRGVAISILALVACGGAASAATPHVDDFATDGMAWGGGGVSLAWQASGGPLGSGDGYLRVTSLNHLATLNTSSAWTGDYTAIDAAIVSVDMKLEAGSEPLSMRLVLFGPGPAPQTTDRWTSTVPALVPADDVWRNYSFSVAEAELFHAVGLNSYQAMFTSVVQVMLRHDKDPPSSGGDFVSATLGIDNVRLAAAPLPGDYNRDGEVDLGDYHTWHGMFGATDSAADGNKSGRVDAADYAFWRDRTTLPTVEMFAVPEVDSLSLASLAAIVGVVLTSRRSSAEKNGAIA